MNAGEVGILNVGAGDVRISFDPKNVAERLRAARIVTDMLRRGYALLVEVERRGKKSYQRALRFNEKHCEYVIADFDPSVVEPEPEAEHVERPAPSQKKGRTRTIKAERTRAVAVAPSAGG